MLSPSLQLTALASWADNSRFLTYLISEDEKNLLACQVSAGWEIHPQPGKSLREGRENHGIRFCWGT